MLPTTAQTPKTEVEQGRGQAGSGTVEGRPTGSGTVQGRPTAWGTADGDIGVVDGGVPCSGPVQPFLCTYTQSPSFPGKGAFSERPGEAEAAAHENAYETAVQGTGLCPSRLAKHTNSTWRKRIMRGRGAKARMRENLPEGSFAVSGLLDAFRAR